MNKICSKCKISKDTSEFYKDSRYQFGVKGVCKDCHCRHMRELEYTPNRKSTYRKYRQSEKGRASRVANQKAYADRWPEKIKAQVAVSKAKRTGDITEQPCEICGNLNVEAHHDDYNEPLNVRWLCKKHHDEYHRRN